MQRGTLCTLAALALVPLSAHAQSWPQRPVTFVVSQSAGASPDVMARMVATKLSAILGQTVVIENKPSQPRRR
jgi:tripartite-type tricarboxylate transporter receptor subunit TctC